MSVNGLVKDATPTDIQRISSSKKLVIVDCWAPWCAPCRTLGPILEELESKYSDNDEIAFLKINVQEHRNFGASNRISAIPCVLVYHNGNRGKFNVPGPRGKEIETDRIIGLRKPEDYEFVIKQFL
ncbi:thioredoxin [Candidatus Thorarchaeota archaeon]|nr:MAG: thioredoxin [Candidatus Thorarchaeota archaeon]